MAVKYEVYVQQIVKHEALRERIKTFIQSSPLLVLFTIGIISFKYAWEYVKNLTAE